MIHVSQTVAVNGDREPRLGVAEMWHGLKLKAEEPMQFVRGIAACRVLQRLPDGLVREIDLRGKIVRERILYRERESVTFVRLNGDELGMIRNEIVDDPVHGLALRFTFDIEIAELAPGSREEAAFAAARQADYRTAVEGTIDRVRALVKEGRLAA